MHQKASSIGGPNSGQNFKMVANTNHFLTDLQWLQCNMKISVIPIGDMS